MAVPHLRCRAVRWREFDRRKAMAGDRVIGVGGRDEKLHRQADEFVSEKTASLEARRSRRERSTELFSGIATRQSFGDHVSSSAAEPLHFPQPGRA